MSADLSTYPDWWAKLYCSNCRKRRTSCECNLSFAEKAKTLQINYWKLKAKREQDK